MNIQLAEKIISSVIALGVKDFILCAGARNSPLVFLLEKAKGVQTYNFFEERSASFFALGRSVRDHRPVAVITTSGTAVSELLSAAVEGTYSQVPLILITADRPRSYRGTGAPQSIDQVGIFSKYVETCIDIADVSEPLDFSIWSGRAPLQINVCFDEPLIDGEVPVIDAAEISVHEKKTAFFNIAQKRKIHSPVVIVGSLKEHEAPLVREFLEKIDAPIYAEAISNLRGYESLEKKFLKGGEKSVEHLLKTGVCQSVLRIGGVPTLRMWRDLEGKYEKIPVYSVSDTDFTGLSRRVGHLVGYQNIHAFEVDGAFSEQQQDLDFILQAKIQKLIEKYPDSEVSLLQSLALRLKNQAVYVGNSLPIREWDIIHPCDLKLARLSGHRGANGIDGQLSGFMGWSRPDQTQWAIVGDLTALYDLISLWPSPALQVGPQRILIINNGGGQIFKNIFQKEIFLNQHQIKFEKWAEMFGWNYQQWSQIPDVNALPDKVVIELTPNNAQSDSFWQEYRHL